MNATLKLVGAGLLVLALLVACGEETAAPTPGIEISCVPVQLAGPDGRPVDISGAWEANDGGVYYIKQINSCVWWSGLSNFEGQEPGQEWVMTFFGRLDADGRLRGNFVDVKGTNPGSGTMTIRVQTEQREGAVVTELHREEATGHTIGVTFWQRQAADPTPDPDQSPGASPDQPAPSPDEPAESPDTTGDAGPGDSPQLSLPPG